MPGLHGAGPTLRGKSALRPFGMQNCCLRKFASREYWSVEWFNRVDGPMRRASPREMLKESTVSAVFHFSLENSRDDIDQLFKTRARNRIAAVILYFTSPNEACSCKRRSHK